MSEYVGEKPEQGGQCMPCADEIERPTALHCTDCRLLYGDPGWADFVVADDVWQQIAPEGGVLCATCMFRRMVGAGIDNIDGRFTSGPCAQHDWRKPGASQPPFSAPERPPLSREYEGRDHRGIAQDWHSVCTDNDCWCWGSEHHNPRRPSQPPFPSLVQRLRDQQEQIERLSDPLQRIMARLAELLDEDHFAEIEGIVTRAGVTPPPEAWQPIETAPKDGTWFLAWRAHGVLPLVLKWDTAYDAAEDLLGEHVYHLTHWMPLPSGPTKGAEGQS